ncbi:hypothetical protein MSIMFI_00619 [Mycobacterium simulans]|nr:hypothetical protein MSIMFI_00619 [Mycobacterium simulans]
MRYRQDVHSAESRRAHGRREWRQRTYEKSESYGSTLDFASTNDTGIDEHGYRRLDNVTNGIHKLYRDAIGQHDLKKMLPHIPTPETRERFDRLAEAGRKLAELHVNYESVEPYPLEVQLKPGVDPADRETWRVQKMKWRSKKDHSAIVGNRQRPQ